MAETLTSDQKLERIREHYMDGIEPGDEGMIFTDPDATLNLIWDVLNNVPTKVKSKPDNPPANVSSTGHTWPCTRFYTAASERDACTCGAADA